MKSQFAKKLNIVLTGFIASVWFVNGLYCKVLNQVPRHQAIVAEILSIEYSRSFIVLIGCAEILMAIWVVSKIRSHYCAVLQIVIVASMNIIEFFLVPDLLLWGQLNAVFAVLFIAVVYYNEFVLSRKLKSRL